MGRRLRSPNTKDSKPQLRVTLCYYATPDCAVLYFTVLHYTVSYVKADFLIPLLYTILHVTALARPGTNFGIPALDDGSTHKAPDSLEARGTRVYGFLCIHIHIHVYIHTFVLGRVRGLGPLLLCCLLCQCHPPFLRNGEKL